jgi:hypothetical protein
MSLSNVDSGVDIVLSIPDSPASSTTAGSGGAKKLKETGQIWVTDQRVRPIHVFSQAIKQLNMAPHPFLSHHHTYS